MERGLIQLEQQQLCEVVAVEPERLFTSADRL